MQSLKAGWLRQRNVLLYKIYKSKRLKINNIVTDIRCHFSILPVSTRKGLQLNDIYSIAKIL